jgi:putative redox protein
MRGKTMDDIKESKIIEEPMDDYKTKVVKMNRGTLVWEKDLIFTARTNRGYEVEYDAKQEMGCSPTETLLLSVAGCMGIDIVSILKKMKCDIRTFKMDIKGDRNPVPPQYYTSIEIFIDLSGAGLDSDKIDRAISLSHEKYCSVFHSLRKDIKFSVDYKFENV